MNNKNDDKKNTPDNVFQLRPKKAANTFFKEEDPKRLNELTEKDIRKFTTNAVLKSNPSSTTQTTGTEGATDATSGKQPIFSRQIEAYLPKDLSAHLKTVSANLEAYKKAHAERPGAEVDDLAKDLGELKQVHSRLKFMLGELEQIVLE